MLNKYKMVPVLSVASLFTLIVISGSGLVSAAQEKDVLALSILLKRM